MYRILSIDGGGLRGVLAAAVLERLAARRPGWLERVDLLAGTSTGAILALALAAGRAPGEIRRMYEEQGAAIFADTVVDDVRDLGNAVGAEYSNVALRGVLEQHFGALTLAELKQRVLVAAFDLDNEPAEAGALRTWKPKFFHNFPGPGSDGAVRVVDAALRSTAAPTYFPVYQGYIDGGVAANNPSMCALAQALEPRTGGQQLGQVQLLSLGTGRCPRYLTTRDADWGWAQWAQPLVEIVFGDGPNSVADYQCRQMLGPRYLRLSPSLSRPVGLDDATAIPDLLAAARSLDLTEAVRWIDEGNG